MTNLKNLKKKVEHCLEKYPQSRNSDTKLTNAVWVEFYPEKLNNINGEWSVPLSNLYHIPSQDAVSRSRRLFQEKGYFLPTDPEVTRKRRLKTQEVLELLTDNQIDNIFHGL